VSFMAVFPKKTKNLVGFYLPVVDRSRSAYNDVLTHVHEEAWISLHCSKLPVKNSNRSLC